MALLFGGSRSSLDTCVRCSPVKALLPRAEDTSFMITIRFA